MKRKGIIVGIVGIVLALAGGGAYEMKAHKKSAKMVADAAQAALARKSYLFYVPMRPIGVPVVFNGQIRYYQYVGLSIEVDSRTNKDLVELRMPVLRDAFLQAVNDAPPVSPTIADSIDIKALRTQLLRQARHVFGPGVVLAVLITNSFRVAA